MAFGKKTDDTPAATGAQDDGLDDAPAAIGADAGDHAEAPPADEAVPQTDGAPATTSPETPGTDALLSMFQTTKDEVDDLAVLVDLAGETDLADILDELRTLRAALGITDAYDDQPALAA